MDRPIAAYLALSGLLVPTTFGCLLVAAHLRGWHSSQKYAQTVENEKPTIAIAVQVLSHSLGLFEICALCSVIALSFHRQASSSSFSLNTLRFVNSAFALRFDWNLPFHLHLPLMLFIAFSLVPAALWSGALTPNVVVSNVTETFRIPAVRTVDLSENALFSNNPIKGEGCPWITGDTFDLDARHNISFHDCVNPAVLLRSASTTSALTYIPGQDERKGHVHSKLDFSNYVFVGRSYGVGGSVGLFSDSKAQQKLSFTFTETSLHAQVKCIFNDTATFRLEELSGNDLNLKAYSSVGDGTLPEGLSASYGISTSALYVGYSAFDVFSLASAYNNHSASYYALAADATACGNSTASCGYGFAQLNGMQCRLDFRPRNFTVSVDNVNKTISVTPDEIIARPKYMDSLLEMIAVEHSYMSYNDGCFAGSTLGHALRSNIDILRASGLSSSGTNATMLEGVESFIADLMDNTLMWYSQSRLYSGESKHVPSLVSRKVVVYGKAEFVYAAVCVHFLIAAICIFEALRTRFWKHLSGMDLLDAASVAVGASYGGTVLAAHVQTMGTAGLLLPGSRPAAKEFTGKVLVKLRNVNGTMCAIEPADSNLDRGAGGTLLSSRDQSPNGVSNKQQKYTPVPILETN